MMASKGKPETNERNGEEKKRLRFWVPFFGL
jgi:hypothetical protein